MRPESVGQQPEIEPPSAPPVGMEDHPVVVSFLRLPSAQVATVHQINLDAGEADLETSMGTEACGIGADKHCRARDVAHPQSAPESNVHAHFGDCLP